MKDNKKAFVKNAADPKQVREAERKEKDKRFRELEDLKAILSLPHGRRFLWRLLEHCSVFDSIWRPSAEIHHLAGKQDVGHFILAEVGKADENQLFNMMKEAKE